jgi:hypothetical protein
MQKHDRIFFGRFEDGKLKIRDKGRLDMLAGLLDKKELKIEISEYRSTRSGKQNGYYWAVVIPMIAEHQGCEKWEYDQVHYDLKRQILGTKKKGKLDIVQSSAKMDTLEFTEYIEAVRRWAAKELGLNIPDPI